MLAGEGRLGKVVWGGVLGAVCARPRGEQSEEGAAVSASKEGREGGWGSACMHTGFVCWGVQVGEDARGGRGVCTGQAVEMSGLRRLQQEGRRQRVDWQGFGG